MFELLRRQYGIQQRYHGECNGHKPEALALVAIASQMGMAELMTECNAGVFTGGLVYNVGPDGYLYRASDELNPNQPTQYYAGDMGKLLAPLPPEYDAVAPWNRIRREQAAYWSAIEAELGIKMLRAPIGPQVSQ